jgi:hypothetical protein
LLLLTALTSAQYSAQPLPEGRITGTVVDADGTPVYKVSVSLLDAVLADLMETHNVTTDSDRGFAIKNPSASIVPKLGSKTGFLSGSVGGKQTKKPIAAVFEFMRAADQQRPCLRKAVAHVAS